MLGNEFFSFNEEKYFVALADILGCDPNYYSEDKSVSALIELIGIARDFDLIYKFQKSEILRFRTEYEKLKKEVNHD